MIHVSASTKFNYNLTQNTRQRAWKLVVAAAHIVRIRAITLASRPAKRIRKRRKRNTSKGRKGSQYTVYVGSRPGQPPQARRGFGHLPMNVHVEYYPSNLAARLGVLKSARYMAYLEVGTSRIAPRPWLTRALDETSAALKALRPK